MLILSQPHVEYRLKRADGRELVVPIPKEHADEDEKVRQYYVQATGMAVTVAGFTIEEGMVTDDQLREKAEQLLAYVREKGTKAQCVTSSDDVNHALIRGIAEGSFLRPGVALTPKNCSVKDACALVGFAGGKCPEPRVWNERLRRSSTYPVDRFFGVLRDAATSFLKDADVEMDFALAAEKLPGPQVQRVLKRPPPSVQAKGKHEGKPLDKA